MIKVTADTSSLLSLERTLPGVYIRACGQAASVFRRKLRAVLMHGGGRDGVPKLKGRAWGFPAGGRAILQGRSVDLRTRVRAWRRGRLQFIGWPGRLGDWVGEVLEAERRAWTSGERSWVAKRSRSLLRGGYNRPARPVMEPFAQFVAQHLRDYIAGAANRLLEKGADK